MPTPSVRGTVFPFLVGCPRSGTTLLRAMLDAHPHLAIPGESHFITRMARQRGGYERSGSFAADRFLDELVADPRFARWHLPPEATREAIERCRPASLAAALRAVFAAYAARQGKPRYGDKTPGYVRDLPLLAQLFPEARFVHIVRDGRDVALSLRDMAWAPGGVDVHAAFWRTNVERAFEARGALGAARYHEIRYERLVEDPEGTLRGVCSFLELPYRPEMLTYAGRSEELAGSLRNAADHRNLRRPPIKGLRDWRTQMSRDDLRRFESIAAETLMRAGYSLAT